MTVFFIQFIKRKKKTHSFLFFQTTDTKKNHLMCLTDLPWGGRLLLKDLQIVSKKRITRLS